MVEANGLFIEVPTQQVKPSQTCPKCGRQEKKTLDQRMHVYPYGCTENRDVAAAQVMLNWGLGTDLLKRGSASSSCYGSFKQLAEMKRQKLRSESLIQTG